MLLIEGLRSLQRPTYLQTPIGGHHHQLRSLDLVGQLTNFFGPLAPCNCPIYLGINIIVCDTFWSFLTPKL